MCSAALLCAILILSVGSGLSALGRLFGYSPEQEDVGGPVAVKWPALPIHWRINPRIGSKVHTSGGDTVDTAVGKAFSTWQSSQVNGQTLTGISFTEDASTGLTDPDSADCLNTVSFGPSSAIAFPTGTIAFTDVATVSGAPPTTYDCTQNGVTTTQTCNLESCIVDADIAFNPGENFSTTTPPLSGDFDVQATATHEIGHFLGLDHSGIANAIMYPFGDTVSTGQPRVLAIDDKVGVAFLYPGGNFASATGTISGRVTLSGSGTFAAHVIAIDAASGNAVVDGLTDTSGNYSLVGVPPGNYDVLALPLTGVYDLSHFGGWYCGFRLNSPPCCDPATDSTCTGSQIPDPTNYTGKFH
jgi:hypothetical protein